MKASRLRKHSARVQKKRESSLFVCLPHPNADRAGFLFCEPANFRGDRNHAGKSAKSRHTPDFLNSRVTTPVLLTRGTGAGEWARHTADLRPLVRDSLEVSRRSMFRIPSSKLEGRKRYKDLSFAVVDLRISARCVSRRRAVVVGWVRALAVCMVPYRHGTGAKAHGHGHGPGHQADSLPPKPSSLPQSI
jgi:hypothetical protein